MKISCYISAFNIEKGQFDFQSNLKKCLDYFDEVVVSTIRDNEDRTFNILEKEARDTGIETNIKIIKTDLSINTPLLDGRLKNEALKNT